MLSPGKRLDECSLPNRVRPRRCSCLEPSLRIDHPPGCAGPPLSFIARTIAVAEILPPSRGHVGTCFRVRRLIAYATAAGASVRVPARRLLGPRRKQLCSRTSIEGLLLRSRRHREAEVNTLVRARNPCQAIRMAGVSAAHVAGCVVSSKISFRIQVSEKRQAATWLPLRLTRRQAGPRSSLLPEQTASTGSPAVAGDRSRRPARQRSGATHWYRRFSRGGARA